MKVTCDRHGSEFPGVTLLPENEFERFFLDSLLNAALSGRLVAGATRVDADGLQSLGIKTTEKDTSDEERKKACEAAQKLINAQIASKDARDELINRLFAAGYECPPLS